MSASQLAEAMGARAQQQAQVLATGIQPEVYAAVRKLLPGVQYQARARTLLHKPEDSQAPRTQRLPGTLALLSAGAADLPVAEECKAAAEHLGCYVMAKTGLTVADMNGLLQQLPAIQAADVVIVVAGVDSALPSVVAGLTLAPIIAVPTSAGAAGTMQGLAPLAACASGCVPGVSVVNIDGGVNAAAMAARILRTAAARVLSMQASLAAQAAAAAAAPAPAHAQVNNAVSFELAGAMTAH